MNEQTGGPRTLLKRLREVMAEDLGALRPAGVSRAENPERRLLDPGAFFGDDRPLWLEIGFGGGEHLVHMAARHPGVGLIGCEPFINGVAMLLGKIRAAGVTNLVVHPGDVRDLMGDRVAPRDCEPARARAANFSGVVASCPMSSSLAFTKEAAAVIAATVRRHTSMSGSIMVRRLGS